MLLSSLIFFLRFSIDCSISFTVTDNPSPTRFPWIIPSWSLKPLTALNNLSYFSVTSGFSPYLLRMSLTWLLYCCCISKNSGLISTLLLASNQSFCLFCSCSKSFFLLNIVDCKYSTLAISLACTASSTLSRSSLICACNSEIVDLNWSLIWVNLVKVSSPTTNSTTSSSLRALL